MINKIIFCLVLLHSVNHIDGLLRMKRKYVVAKGLPNIINKYWCWRAKYCQVTDVEVCTVDRRKMNHRIFRNECGVFKYNCFKYQVLLHLIHHIESVVWTEELSIRYARYMCHKQKNCVPKASKVCGFDDEEAHLAYFDNICLLYGANCKREGRYEEVDMKACDSKKNYVSKFKDDIIFEKIDNIFQHGLGKHINNPSTNFGEPPKNPIHSGLPHGIPQYSGLQYNVPQNGDSNKGIENTSKDYQDLTHLKSGSEVKTYKNGNGKPKGLVRLVNGK